MTPEEMAEIHSCAMTHSVAWGVPTLTAFLEAKGAIVVTQNNCFALGRVIADEAELLTIAVHPSAQNAGIGRVCLEAFEQEAKTNGAKRVFLEVSVENTLAVRLYSTAGYAENGRRAAYYTSRDGKKSDALIMSKSLTPA